MTAIADGTVETRDDGKAVIRFERRLAHPIDRVWQALTDHDDVIRWWGDLDAELVPGGRFVLRWLNSDDQGNSSTWQGTVAEIDPPRVLETSGHWGSRRENWQDPDATLRFELTPDGDGTILRFTNVVPLPDEFRSKILAGWHWHFDALGDALEGRPDRDLTTNEGWEPIHELYVEQLSAR